MIVIDTHRARGASNSELTSTIEAAPTAEQGRQAHRRRRRDRRAGSSWSAMTCPRRTTIAICREGCQVQKPVRNSSLTVNGRQPSQPPLVARSSSSTGNATQPTQPFADIRSHEG